MYLINLFAKPSWVFSTAKEAPNSNYILVTFSVATLIVLLKGLARESEIFTLFQSDELNQFLGLLSNPIVSLLITYITFLGFIYLSFYMGGRFGKKCSFKQYLFSVISISLIGVIGHLLSFLIEDLLPDSLRLAFFYVFFFWVCTYSILAIKLNFELSIPKSALVFFFSLLPVFLLKGPLAISPYLSWLI